MGWCVSSQVSFHIWDDAVVAYHDGSGATHFFDGIEAWVFEQLSAGPQTLTSLQDAFRDTVDGDPEGNLEPILAMFGRLGVATNTVAS